MGGKHRKQPESGRWRLPFAAGLTVTATMTTVAASHPSQPLPPPQERTERPTERLLTDFPAFSALPPHQSAAALLNSPNTASALAAIDSARALVTEPPPKPMPKPRPAPPTQIKPPIEPKPKPKPKPAPVKESTAPVVKVNTGAGTIDLSLYSSVLKGTRPHVARAGHHIADKFNFNGSILGFGSRSSGTSDHPKGLALDFMTSDKAYGDSIAAYALANKSKLRVSYVIWRQRFNDGSGWKTMKDRGSVTANHYDHVHISFHP